MTRRRWVLAAVVAALALGAFVVVWFEPQALWFDDEVDEAAPSFVEAGSDEVGSDDDDEDEGAPPAPAEVPAIVAEGTFRGVEGHDVRDGVAQLFELPDGSHVLRLETLDAENGPDLKVYLSAAPADGDADAHDDDYISLGGLKGNIGSSNYPIPADVDLERYGTAVIWCERFSVGFAVAELTPT